MREVASFIERGVEEKWTTRSDGEIATYASRVCAIALVAEWAFASNLAVNVTGQKMFVSAASVMPERSLAQWGGDESSKAQALMDVRWENQRAGDGCGMAELTGYHLVGRCRRL